MDRRDFLVGAGLLAVAPTASSAAQGVDWGAVRREFRLDPGLTNLGLFYLASNPREVRDAVEEFKVRLDTNSHDLMPDQAQQVAVALGEYVGGAADDIAFVPNTTIGLSIVYGGLKMRADQELLLNDQDHSWHQQAARLAASRVGAKVRIGTLYENPAKATEDEIAVRLRNSITPQTRAVGITWVQSSTGLRMPVRACAAVVAEANKGRAPQDRCLLIVDGVHGLAAVDDDAARMGADVFVAGTHKWLFGPRGTGMVWVNPEVSREIVPLLPSLSDRSRTAALGPGGFHAFEHYFAVQAAVRFHQRLGRDRVASRITELAVRFKDGLAEIPGVVVHTPRDPATSAGMVCFDVAGHTGPEVVELLGRKQIQITTASYRIPYARVGTSILNTPEEIDRTLREISALA
ncbi:aminotransferase class V-fold PLP-dependent enzyme [Lentzea sp. NBC_00516]|uniref:aminotransferase class V-fold PLP-dependent enzyme n=1 Tax=Lentzea sp. NBC_00516 TaxID=2903582 RepID=UPI002E81DECA|nr:aminotransferase class V-fold PLP-dependent enzyme [Lentzea sp. NBC_00516]WUD24709.1 aminotransferase class V-fold PLP-dependent enzyme [Lentzea sp. NBC_00516]